MRPFEYIFYALPLRLANIGSNLLNNALNKNNLLQYWQDDFTESSTSLA